MKHHRTSYGTWIMVNDRCGVEGHFNVLFKVKYEDHQQYLQLLSEPYLHLIYNPICKFGPCGILCMKFHANLKMNTAKVCSQYYHVYSFIWR